jgi:hypothetical protein
MALAIEAIRRAAANPGRVANFFMEITRKKSGRDTVGIGGLDSLGFTKSN